MIQSTLGAAKEYLAPIAGNTGMPVDDELLAGYINKAIEELSRAGDWPGVVDRWYFRFDQATGEIALPYQFERLMQVTVDDVPREIRSPWYEFVQYGPGNLRDLEFDGFGNRRPGRYNGWHIVADRGEHPTKVPIPLSDGTASAPWVLRVYAAVDEDVDGIPPVLNVQGIDSQGQVVRTLSDGTSGNWLTGENIAIDFDVPYTEGSVEFSQITGIQKPATNQHVKLTAWNGTTEIELADFLYNETVPTYRRYFIPALYRTELGQRHRIVLARCRRRFQPASEDQQVLMIGNLLALEEMMIAQYKRQVGAAPEYILHRQSAIDLMKEESQAQMGKARVPSITFQRGFPVGVYPYCR